MNRRQLCHSIQWESNQLPFKTEREERKSSDYSASTFSDFHCVLELSWPRGLGLTLTFLQQFIDQIHLRHTAILFKHPANYLLPSVSQYLRNSGKEILPHPSFCIGNDAAFFSGCWGEVGIWNLFALCFCREFKQTKKFIGTVFMSAKQYFPVTEKEAHLPTTLQL